MQDTHRAGVGSYPSAKKQSVYCSARADKGNLLFQLYK